MSAMSPRTRSDILAAASGYAAPIAAGEMLSSAKLIGDESKRVLLDALEFAIEYARGEDESELLRLENEALRADLQEIEDRARRGTHGAR